MLENLFAYCIHVVENVYAFFYNFLLSYRSYVAINVAILVGNLLLLKTVHYYMSKRTPRHPESLTVTKPKFERKSQPKSTRPQPCQVSSSKVPSFNVPRQQTPRPTKNPPNPIVVTPRPSEGKNEGKNEGKTTPALQKCLTPPAEVHPPPENVERPTSVEVSEETLDEITWACDDSHSSLDNSDNTKQGFSQDKIKPAKDVRASKSSHLCRRMGKSTDVRDDQQLGDGGNIVKLENQQKNNRIRQDGKKRQKDDNSQTKTKSYVQKKKTGKLKQRHKKVSREMNIAKQSEQQNSEEPGMVACAQLPPDVKQEVVTHFGEKRISVNEARAKRIIHKQHPSPRLTEIVKNSSGDSKNSLEESDLEMAASDQQFHGNRSESSLVCKRDSWIWFSPEIRSSVEDFAARQRKFRSRDPRVAELAFEISRQEEMNRDIERAAESLIDSSSPSTCKLLDGSKRKHLCGAMKTRASRKSRVAPYTIPDIKKLSVSPVSRLAGGDHANKGDNEYNDRGGVGNSLCSGVMKILPTTTKSEKQTEKIKDSRALTPKRRKTRQKVSNQQTKGRDDMVVGTKPSTTSPASSEHSHHSEADVNTSEGESLPRAINWYNSPAASVIRRLYTPSRYSPLYDNTTLACSTQCSLCSVVSNSPENTKVTGNQQKHRAAKSDQGNEREGFIVRGSKQSSPIEIKGSPGEINLLSTKHVHDDMVTSPTPRQCNKGVPESFVTSKGEVESGPESPSNVQEKYTNRLSPTWKSSKRSPRKRRFCDRGVSITNRSTPENRIENYKYARKSPQLTFSTGESESDSVYRDKSVGPDASYRQCMISKEVNTTVQRLLFDTEKSSSSHSPSSRSKVHFPDVNTDEDSNTLLTREHTKITNIARLRESCTRIDISRDSPLQRAETEGSKLESSSDKHSSGSHEDRLLGVMNPQSSFISSDSQTLCTCQKMTQKFTNIYARDYYLGKRVTMKKQMEAKASVHSTKWKKLDITWCAKSPCHSRSSLNKSRLSSPRREFCSSSRESPKHKPHVKMLAYASRHSRRSHTSVGCQVTQTISSTSEHNILKDNLVLGTKAGNELNRHDCKCSQMNASLSQHTQDYRKCNKPKVCFREPCVKRSAFRKSSSQLDKSVLPESSAVSPSRKPCMPPRCTALVARCKKEGAAQTEPSTLLAVVSTNNSSNNLSYCSDKSTSSEKPSLFSKTTQFYFVTGAKPSSENSSYQRDSLGNVELSKDGNAEMFQNSQLPGTLLNSSIPLEPDIAVSNYFMKKNHDHEAKETTLLACTTNPVMPAFLTFSELGNYKMQATAGRSHQQDTNVLDNHHTCPAVRSNISPQQATNVLDNHHMCPAVRSNISPQQATSFGMYWSNDNSTISTTLPLSFTIKGDNSRQGRVMPREDVSNSKELKPFDADTADVDHINCVTPVLAPAVKQSSNPDSGYDESLSEKANGDCSFQVSLATAVDLSRTGSSPQWFLQPMCNQEHYEANSWSTSPLSDASRNSDHAHRSHMSNECDSEQDTLPSLSDDTFQNSSNFDPPIHRSPDTSRFALNARSILFMNDMTREDIYQDSLFNKVTGPNVATVSPQGLNKAIGKSEVHPDWTSRHNTQFKTENTGNTRKLVPDNNQLLPRESNWNGREEIVVCHSTMTLVPPASIENVYIEDCQGVTNGPERAPEETSHNADLSKTANNTPDNLLADNTANSTTDHSLAEMLNAFYSRAKFSQTLETDLLETFTQANSNPIWSGVRIRTPEQGAQLSNALYKPAGNPELFESKTSALTQSDQDTEHIWSTAPQVEQARLTCLPTFNWKDSNEKYLTPRREIPLTTNTVLDWLPLDGSKLAESIIGVPSKELDQPGNASSPEGSNHAKTINSPYCLTACTADIPEGSSHAKTINSPYCLTACTADIPEGSSHAKTINSPYCLTACTADIPEGSSHAKTINSPYCLTACTADIPEGSSHAKTINSAYCLTACTADIPEGSSHAKTTNSPNCLTVCTADIPEGSSHAKTTNSPYCLTVCTADIPEGSSHAKTINSPYCLTVCTADIPEGVLPQSITLPPTSSDEEDDAGGDGCYDTLAYTSDSEPNDNSTDDYWTGGRAKPPCIDNGKLDPSWSCNTDSRDNIVPRKLHQNNYRQSTNTHLSQRTKDKVFIANRSIEFSEILKRF